MEASKLNLMAPINSLGYGVAGLNILKHLMQDIDVTLFPINHLNSCDEIIVASNWAADVVKGQIKNSIPVHVVPLGVDMGIFNDANFVSTNKCVFFNCGKWEKRKGHDVLLEAFKIAFPSEDDVELWMMTNNPFITNPIIA